jgi:hypothetical protein
MAWSKADAAESGVVTSRPMPVRTLLLPLLLAGAIVIVDAGPARAQEGFRVVFEVDRSRADRARLTGRVVNERTDDVFEVSVTAEALDARGKVLSRGIAYVDGRIGRGDERPFSLSVPTVSGTSSFRVVVSSYRAGFATQGP